MEGSKRLLQENTRLINERNELSSVLGEEKEMVRYLHGVIKNYEHLLRYNSSQRENRYRPSVYRNMTEEQIDHDSISNENQPKVSVKLHKTSKDSQNKEKAMTSSRLGCSLEERHHDMVGLQTVKREVKQETFTEDEICLEDLEILSASSTEEPSDNSLLPSAEMERKRWNERIPSKKSEKHVKTSRSLSGISRDGHQNSSDNYQRLDIHSRTRPDDKTLHGKLVTNDNNQNTRILESSLDTELDELNKELDRIASKLNRHENSLHRSEKHLSKMEHRMEYLESFALGKESEYL